MRRFPSRRRSRNAAAGDPFSRSGACGALGLFALGVLLGPAGHGEEGEIPTPYQIEAQVWRDEQPGAEPSLHLSARFVPRTGVPAWSDVVLAGLVLRAGRRRWQPETSELEALVDGGFEVRARGPASLAAGSTVVPVVQLRTSAGPQELVLPESVVERVE